MSSTWKRKRPYEKAPLDMWSPWKRQRPYKKAGYPRTNDYTFLHSFLFINENKCVDIDSKLAALKVAPSIVSLVSHSGENELFVCSGTIIECEEESNGTFFSTILTSASLIRCPSGEPVLAPDIKVVASLSDGKLFKCQVFAFDFNFNVAAINIKSNCPLANAILRNFDVTMLVNPSALHGPRANVVDLSTFQLRRHVDKAVDSNLFKLCPGDKVVALGRHYRTHDLMAAPGEFSVNCCDFDCEELFMASCKITKSGIGGPLINRSGEVIGINFYDSLYTPFLPINIASKCLDDLKKHGRVRRPWLGVEVTNLYAASVDRLQKIVQKLPSICKGVIVDKVISKSPADCAGICPDDIIVQCSGNDVGCFTEFCGIIWDKAGKSVELVVMRESVGACLNLTMVADETSPDKYYRWPVPEEWKPQHQI